MTDERKNEIWAMLDAEEQEWVKKQNNYITENIPFDNGYNCALQDIFGAHNLTAQAEETCKENAESFTDGSKCVKESSNSFQSFTDWNKYRLDLAKEIALRLVDNLKVSTIVSHATIAIDSVSLADEIVKRLKETEV